MSDVRPPRLDAENRFVRKLRGSLRFASGDACAVIDVQCPALKSCAEAPFGRVIGGWTELDEFLSEKRETHCFQWVSVEFIGCGDRI